MIILLRIVCSEYAENRNQQACSLIAQFALLNWKKRGWNVSPPLTRLKRQCFQLILWKAGKAVLYIIITSLQARREKFWIAYLALVYRHTINTTVHTCSSQHSFVPNKIYFVTVTKASSISCVDTFIFANGIIFCVSGKAVFCKMVFVMKRKSISLT